MTAGPRGWPLLGSLVPFARDPLGFLTESQRIFGSSFSFWVGPLQFRVLGTPSALRTVLVDHAERYAKGPGYDGLRLVLRSGSFVAEGEAWRARRQALQPLYRTEQLAERLPAIGSAVDEACARWGGTFDAQVEFTTLAIDVVGRALLGQPLAELGDAFRCDLDVCIGFAYNYGNELAHPPLWLPTPGRRRYRTAVQRLRDRTLALREKGGAAVDALAALPAEAAVDELVVQLAAGSETTASALTFALALAASDPACAARIREEASALPASPSLADLKVLRFTTAVWLEALRLYPPIWFLERRALQDDLVDGTALPAGSIAVICPWALHRDEAVWPDPLRFDPLRFIDGPPTHQDRFRWLPYGVGPRSCAGAQLATLEAKLVLARIFQRFEVHSPGLPAPLARLSLRPDPAFRLQLDRR